MKRYFILSIFCIYALSGVSQTLPNPIMFCTQVPQPFGFGTSLETFGNQQASTFSAPRGGDLYIRYTDGSLKNLTQTAGFGQNGMQGANAIAVRDPSVHWSGTKALFSMVIGSATQRYQVQSYTWKIYEITGLGKNETPVITLVPNQPIGYNNIQPIYGTDDRIIFISDMPRGGIAHLYPQHDEYESSPIVSGIWRLDPKACSIASGLEMLTHSPSGDFTPSIDNAGRLIFTRWDHLQRDQQADADIEDILNNTGNDYNYGTFNYADETANATKSAILPDAEIFPEPRPGRTDLLSLPQWANTNPQSFNIFNPWMMNEDGTEMEILNHLGRHDMQQYITPNFTNDPKIHDFYTPISQTPIRGMFHIQESPVTPGLYYGIEAPEFGTHGSGMVVSVNAPPGMHPEQVTFTYVTHPDTRSADATPSVNHSGLYRNPMPLSNGKIVVSHSHSTEEDSNIGASGNPLSKYDYRIRLLEATGGYFKASATALTGAGITKNVSWWSPDELYTYNGVLWETYPVEVRARALPTKTTLNIETVAPSELALFTSAGVNLHDFRKFLNRNNLSVLAIRDVTSRDDQDQQQPFNLKVSGTAHQTVSNNPSQASPVYNVKHLQFFQNDLVRGIGGINTPKAGRRGLARFLHDPTAMTYNPPTTGSQGSANIHPDGSVAMIVPAKRALTWQLTDDNNKGIVRERLWISTKSGEIRTCTSCHGESTLNQAGQPSPSNPPQALTTLLNHVKTIDSDNDGVKDIYDAFPNDGTKSIAEAVNEKFVANLANWINQNLDNDAVTWTTQSNTCHANSAMINNRALDNTGKIDRLRRFVDLSNMDFAKLSFDVAYARYDASKFDRLKVYVVLCDGSQQLIYDKAGTTLATAPDQTTLFTPAACNQWRNESINLSAYAGKTVELVFENVGGWGNRLFLDNILIQEIDISPPCPNSQSFSGNLTTGKYNAATTIITQSGVQTRVVAGANVTFNGGSSVTLQTGFEAQNGSVFKAYIGGCGY
ncbi:3-coathanger stack domain-containing protein [Emticicia sp. SJ17W-69]|uniref:3-coathanger stack domain-containing protein n=1 Tax=Emticicia sp. SJ17W-69 TaxID=3421657 RepID=UPI003EBDFBD5